MNKTHIYSILLFIAIAGFCSYIFGVPFGETALFNIIEDSPVIFIAFGLVAFLILWALDTISSSISRVFQLNSQYYTYLLLTLIAVWFFGWGYELGDWPPGSLANYVCSFILFIPTFLIYQYLNEEHFSKRKFADVELLKFIFLFISTFIFLVLGSKVGAAFNPNPDTYYSKIDFLGDGIWMPVAFTFAFALGNFLNNLKKYLGKLSGSDDMLQKSQEEVLETRAELDSLQSSINPHFLYNSLNSIAALAKTDGAKTEKMALALSAFYRYVTNKEDKHVSTLGEEINMIENYLVIEKIRFGEKLQVELNYEEEILNANLPHFTLQPIFENAIKYGFNDDGIKIKVDFTVKEGELNIAINDSGKPFDESLSSGYGLKSVSEKLRLLYPDKHQLSFINNPFKHVLLTIQQS